MKRVLLFALCLALIGILTACYHPEDVLTAKDSGSDSVCTGSTASAAETIPSAGQATQIPETSTTSPSALDLPFQAYYVRTNGYRGGVIYPKATLITSKKQLDEYIQANQSLYSFSTNTEFQETTAKYGDAYFKENDLILLTVEESSGSNRHKVEKVQEEDSVITVQLIRIWPDCGTCDIAEWHIFVNIPKGNTARTVNLTVTVEHVKASDSYSKLA